MDEPFGALDAQTRSVMQEELLRIWEAQRSTVLFVTHSANEAVTLADRIVVFTPRPGRIRTIIDAKTDRPRDETGADFAEYKRIVPAEMRDDMRRAARAT